MQTFGKSDSECCPAEKMTPSSVEALAVHLVVISARVTARRYDRGAVPRRADLLRRFCARERCQDERGDCEDQDFFMTDIPLDCSVRI